MHVLGSRLRCTSGCIASKKCPQVSHLGWDPLSTDNLRTETEYSVNKVNVDKDENKDDEYKEDN